jgi:hypothetical protein
MDDRDRILPAVVIGGAIALIAVIVTDARLSDAELVVVRGAAMLIAVALGIGGLVLTMRGGGGRRE